MTRLLVTSFVATLAVGATLMAQSGSAGSAQPAPSAAKSVTVIGCVVQGTSPGTFTLSHGTLSDDKMTEAMAPPNRTKAGADAAMTMAYTLMDAENLKSHIGHKVAVSGMLDERSRMVKPGEKTEASTPGAASPAPEMNGGTIKVQSVKMVSTTCP